MGTSWKDKTVSQNFNQYNDMLEDILGFHHIFQLIQNDSDIQSILDYGCGPGKVSKRLSKLNDAYDIYAVDQSEEMINLASLTRNRANIHYQLIQNNNLNFIKSNSLDCAIVCFVIINNSDPCQIYTMLKEIYRVLKAHGQLIILDSNPNAIGVEFTTFVNGERGKVYKPGDKRKQYLKIPGQPDLILNDWYWSKNDYLAWIAKAGFKSVEVTEPALDRLSQETRQFFEEKYDFNQWGNEKIIPPFVVFKSVKPGD
ncbi:MAG: methyltransferase domain-containing protein [Anaerocolumna sp.]